MTEVVDPMNSTEMLDYVLGQLDGPSSENAEREIAGVAVPDEVRAEATLLADSPIGRAGQVLRGHEFHYATSSGEDDARLATLADADGVALGGAGGRRGLVSGTYFHAIALQGG